MPGTACRGPRRAARSQLSFLALCSALAAPASGQLRLASHSNGVLGAPGALSDAPTVSLPPFDPRAGAHSFSWTGTLTPPASEVAGGLVSFSARAAGALRVFVDDHLVLDAAAPATSADCARNVSGWAAWPPGTGAAVPLRVEYAQQADATCAPALALLWQGNTTALAPVPASALGPPPASGPRAEYTAMRDRLYEPAVPWQTYYAPSMTGHALQPTGLVLLLALASAGGGYLNNVRVFPEFAPAWVRAGGHSYNGSDYAAVHVSRWMAAAGASPLNATVSFFTTTATAAGGACNGTAGNGGLRCDLVAVAACEGGDCAQLQLVVTATYAWAGSGGLAGNASVLTATPTGFAPTLVFADTPPSAGTSVAARPALPAPALVLPFSARADLPWPGTGGGAGMAVAVVSTGAPRSVDDAVALVAAARARYDASAARYGGAAVLYEPMRAILAWNTLFSEFTHVYTPVTRNWYADANAIGTFVWDVFFASVMLSTDAADARARDIACACVITTVFSRTFAGMVPNYSSGESTTYDRTEPAVGSWAVRVLRDRFGAAAAWLPELLFPALVAWHDFFHAQRRNGGVLAASGAAGLADAISLGSDATSPPGLDTPHTLAAARYESGLDNSAQYDGDDGQCSGPSCPCSFNATSSLMNLYDVAFTAYHIADADELIALAGPLNRSDVLPRLSDRATRAAAVLNSAMWSAADGSYSNVLVESGLPVPRWAPTVFAPMFAGVAPRSRLPAMLAMLGDAAVFCVNETHAGSGGSAGVMLINIGAAGAPTALSCASDACLVDAVLTNPGTGALLQAMAQPPAAPAASALLNLTLYATARGAHALTTPAWAPAGADYAPVRVEAACYAAASLAAPVPLTLWSRPAAPPDLCSPHAGLDYVGADIANASMPTAAACCDFCRATPACVLWKWAPAHCYAKSGAAAQPVACADCIVGSSAAAAPAYATCGTAACNASAAAAGLSPAASPMCWVAPVAEPADWPCAVPLPSMGRSDPAFGDQTYWRGRAWAPQTFLVWLGLQRYADDAGAAAARRSLARMASRVFLRQLDLFGQMNENLDGVTGLGSDTARSDSYYHWSALFGFVGLVEAGGFPADVLIAPAPQ